MGTNQQYSLYCTDSLTCHLPTFANQPLGNHWDREREREKKRPGRWQWGQIGGCQKQASPTWRVCVGLAFISFAPKLLVVG